jgi:methyl-accepting chemotaxis protein
MNKLKVSTRLAWLVGTLSVLLAAIGLLGMFGTTRSNAALQTVYADRLVPAEQLGQIRGALLGSELSLAAALLDASPDAVASARARIESHQATITKTWDAYMATRLTPEEERLADAFVKVRRDLVDAGFRPVLAALDKHDLNESRRLRSEVVAPLMVPVEQALESLMKLQIDEARSEYEAATARYEWIRLATMAAMVSGLLGGGAFGWLMSRNIARQLGAEPADAAALAQRVAAGDLAVDIALRPGDSDSMMAQLKQMQLSLARVVREVRDNAEGVATASSQIAQGNGDLSSRTEDQASALQQTAASMEQLSTTVRQNADHAQDANRAARNAADVAERGGGAVARVVQTMRGIDESARRIADIIGVIDGIAFQTNILALNAAVEAARAGDSGRGFAVVAGEVRALAGRSAEAAKQIKTLIGASVEQVERGSALVDEAGATMQAIVGEIGRVSDLMGQISAASAEQSAGVSQVGQVVGQMDRSTQQNAALVEQSAAAAESLHQQAMQLVRSVAVFRLAAAPAA